MIGDPSAVRAVARLPRLLPALLLLFVCSGCAALIYEVVWFQMLRQSIVDGTEARTALIAIAASAIVSVVACAVTYHRYQRL